MCREFSNNFNIFPGNHNHHYHFLNRFSMPCSYARFDNILKTSSLLDLCTLKVPKYYTPAVIRASDNILSVFRSTLRYFSMSSTDLATPVFVMKYFFLICFLMINLDKAYRLNSKKGKQVTFEI